MPAFSMQDFMGAAGELTFAVGFIIMLLWDVALPRGNRKALAFFSAILFVLSAGISIVAAPSGTFFAHTFRNDSAAQFLKVFAALAGVMSVWLSANRFPKAGEYYILLSAVVFGMFIIASANDMILLIVGLETVSVPSYILAGYFRSDRRSGEAALKYVLYGAVSIGAMLYGISLLYGLTGATGYEEIYNALSASSSGYEVQLFIAVLLMLAGFGYKVAAVPFHFWCPDVYEGAPTPMTAFFSVAPKAAGLFALVRFMGTAIPQSTFAAFGGEQLFWWMAVATMTLGNLAALPQTNLKRLLAYSSIAQAGYILTAFTVNSLNAYIAVGLYLIVYLFMNLGAFAVIEWIERSTGSVDLDTYRGLGRKHPKQAVLLSIFLFSLAGIPPFAGFVGKFVLFSALVEGQQLLLALIAVTNSVISVVYYVKVAREMFLTDTESAVTWGVTPSAMGYLVTCAVPTVLLGIAFQPLFVWVESAMKTLFPM